MTPEKIELGRLLFFDKRLSGDNSISCATCHMPALAFTDGQPVSAGKEKGTSTFPSNQAERAAGSLSRTSNPF